MRLRFFALMMSVLLFAVFARAEIPTICIQYPITFWYKHYQEGKTSFMAYCPDPMGAPIRGAGPIPDISQEYAEQVLRGLTSVSDCLRLPIKEILPLIKGESGFVLNSIGKAFDAGIGQLTDSAINDVNWHLGDLKNYLQANSENLNCKIILENWQMLTTHQDSDLSHRCEFLTGPINPFKNILWTIYYVKILRNEIVYNFRFQKIDDALLKLNFPQDRINDLIHILTYLSYNQGSGAATRLLSGYLQGLILNSVSALGPEQFNFTKDLSWLDKIDKSQWKKIPISNLDFPAYVKIYATSGNSQYLAALFRQVLDYNQNIGPNICAPTDVTNFLKL